MSGVVSLSLTFWERIRKSVVATRVFYLIAILCVLTSLFMAWKDQYDAFAAEQQRNQAHVEPVIEDVVVVHLEARLSMIIMTVAINNLGAPTSLHGWDLQVTLPDGTTAAADLVSLPAVPLKLGNDYWLHGADDVVEKTAQNPIPQGGTSVGLAAFTVDVPLSAVARNQTELALSFRDVANHQWKAARTLTGKSSEAPVHMPGLMKPEQYIPPQLLRKPTKRK